MYIDTNKKVANTSETNTESSASQKTETEDGKKFEDFLQDNNINLSTIDSSLLFNMFSIYEMPYSSIDAVGLAQNIQGIKSSFGYDTMTISREDAQFFVDMLDKDTEINYTPATPQSFITTINSVEETQSTSSVSKTLLDLVETSFKTSQPCRLDFDNNVSVILKVDKEGKITANFLPSDAVAEQYLRNNIGFLRQSFETQNIDYNELTYTSYKDRNGKGDKSHRGDDNE